MVGSTRSQEDKQSADNNKRSFKFTGLLWVPLIPFFLLPPLPHSPTQKLASICVRSLALSVHCRILVARRFVPRLFKRVAFKHALYTVSSGVMPLPLLARLASNRFVAKIYACWVAIGVEEAERARKIAE